MRVIEPRIFNRDRFQLGEGPFWFEGRLWWIDVDAGKLHSCDAAGVNRISHEFGRRIGAAVPAGDSKFLLALEDGIACHDIESNLTRIVASPEKATRGNRFNDGKCDPVGRFVAGTMSTEGKPGCGALYSYSGAGRIETIQDSVSISNGLAWSADGRTLYYIDTPTREIASFAYDLETGRLGDRRVVVRVPDEWGLPDGMDIDTDGNLWVAHWDGGAVRCWSATRGDCLAEIPTSCRCPTSCCFGGVGLETLFITSAGCAATGETNSPDSLAGCVFACEPGVAGYPVTTFHPS